MARKSIYPLRRTIATLAGAGLTGLSAWYTWQHYHDVSAPIAAVVGAGMFHLVETCWRDRSPLRALLFLGLGLLAASITLLATLDRVASHKDRTVQERQSENLGRSLAQDAKAEAQRELVAAQAAAASECASGRGTKCRGLEARADEARQRVSAASSELARLGAPIAEDSMAKRLSAVTTLSEATVTLYQPVLLPLWLDLSGLTLLTFGLSQSKPKPKTKPVVVRKKKRRRRSAKIYHFRRAANMN